VFTAQVRVSFRGVFRQVGVGQKIVKN
jgi:hypothetical protein